MNINWTIFGAILIIVVIIYFYTTDERIVFFKGYVISLLAILTYEAIRDLGEKRLILHGMLEDKDFWLIEERPGNSDVFGSRGLGG